MVGTAGSKMLYLSGKKNPKGMLEPTSLSDPDRKTRRSLHTFFIFYEILFIELRIFCV